LIPGCVWAEAGSMDLMSFKLVFLWTDLALWGLFFGLLAYGWTLRSHVPRR